MSKGRIKHSKKQVIRKSSEGREKLVRATSHLNSGDDCVYLNCS